MNYIREAEELLLYYNDLYKSINEMNREVSKLIAIAGPKELSSMTLDVTGIHATGKYDDTINTLYKIQKYLDNIKNTKEMIKKIDEILDDISREYGCKFYGPVLKKWYIERTPKDEIAQQIGYSSRQSIYSIKNMAIRKFAIRMFGIEALKAV